MGIVKLNPDDKVLFTVTATFDDVSQSNGGPQVKFKGSTPTDPDAVMFLSAGNAERQLAHYGLTRLSVVGRTVQFSAKKKGAQKFIDMTVPGEQGSSAVAAAAPSPTATATTVTPPAPSPVDPAAAKAARRDSIARLLACYAKCFDASLKLATEKLETSNIPPTHAGVATSAASLFEAVLQRGLCT